MKPDLIAIQGEGTYTYECRKRDCCYCMAMGLLPLPEEYIDDDPKEFRYRNVTPIVMPKFVRHTSKPWTGIENRILIANRYADRKKILEMLPGRTYKSIKSHTHTLKKIGMI